MQVIQKALRLKQGKTNVTHLSHEDLFLPP